MKINRHLGFTGTKHPITSAQRRQLITTLTEARETFEWMHNGDCVGADEIAALTWRKLYGKLCMHIPSRDKYRAFVQGHVECSPKGYIDRDKDIVNMSELLIATPQTFTEQTRSGTWATIRHARKIRVPVTIIFPDGSVERG